MQRMWFAYCGASLERVSVDTLLLAVPKYLEEQLGMPNDAVAAEPTPDNCTALKLTVDVDTNGKVCRNSVVR